MQLKNKNSFNRFATFFVLSLIGLFLPLNSFAAPPALVVSGTSIQRSDTSCAVTLRGVNVPSLEWGVGEGPPSGIGGDIVQSVTYAIDTMKANIIRLPLDEARWSNWPYSYPQTVDDIVAACSVRNAYVILDLHLLTAYQSGGGNPQQVNMPDAGSTNFWIKVSARFKNNPAVLFGVYNEPFPPDWATWQNGTGGGPGIPALLSTIRSGGATNVCLVGGLQWSYQLTGMPALTDATGNYIFDEHIYPSKGASSAWDTNIGSPGKPVFVGEFGQLSSDGTWDTSTFLPWLAGKPYGATAWGFNANAAMTYGMLTAYFTFNTWHGVPVQNWLSGAAAGCNPPHPAPIPTPVPTSTPVAGTCFLLDNLESGDIVNNTNGLWFTFRWTSVSGAAALPWQAVESCPDSTPCPYILDNAQSAGGGTYSARVTGGYTTNGPTTYAGFALGTELGTGYTNLGSYLTMISFDVRSSQAPVTLRCNAVNPLISYAPVVYQGVTMAGSGGGDDNQYGFNFVVTQANTWQHVIRTANAFECGDWGYNLCPPPVPRTSTTNFMTLSNALTQVTSLQWETQGGPVSFGYWIDNVCLSGASIPNTATPSAVASTPTFTPTLTKTATNSPTNTIAANTNTPTNTATRTATNTPTNSFTNTVTNTLTKTATNSPTNTSTNSPAVPTNTPTNTATRTATNSPTNSSTNTVTNTFTRTATNSPTNTSTNTPAAPTNTPTNTTTHTPTNSPTNSPANTATRTPTNSPTNSPANTGTNTFTSTSTNTPNAPTNTPTNSPTKTPSATPTNSLTSTATNSPSRTPTNSPTNSATNTITLTSTNTPNVPTNTPTNTPTRTPTATSTNSPTNSATNSPTSTATRTPTTTFTNSSTNTATNSPTRTPTNSPTNSPSNTLTSTPTITSTPTNTFTGTQPPTNTATNSPTKTPTSTPTNSPTNSNTNTATNSPTRTSTNSPTSTPTNSLTMTFTNSATRTPTATSTNTAPLITNTPTLTATITPPNTATSSPTNSFTSTATRTPTNSPTVTITSTPTLTDTGTTPPTNTPTQTPTNSLTNTFTKTATNSTTRTPTSTATNSPLITSTFTPTPATVQFSTGSPAPPSTTQLPGTSNVPVLSVVLTNTGTAPVNFTSLTVSDGGSGNPSGISGVSLLNNGSLVAGPVGLAGSNATFSGLSVNIPAGGSVTLQVTANFSNAALAGTYQFSVTAGAGTNGQAVNFTGLPSTGATITIASATATFTNTATPTSTNTSTATPSTLQISTGSPAPPNTTQLPGASNVTVLSVVLTNTGTTAVSFTSLTVSDNGTGNPSGISGINLSNNGSPVAGPVVFAGTSAIFNGLSVNIPGSGSVTLQVAANFSNGATAGTYQFSVSNGAGTNGQAVNLNGLPSTGATVSIAFATATSTSTPTNSVTPTSTWTPTPSATPINNKPVIYPNPSDGTQPVTVQVALAQATDTVQLQVFTLAFRSVQDITVTSLSPNVTASTVTGVSAKTWKIQIPASDKWGSPLASGLYYVVITANGKKTIGKMLILR